MTDTKGHMSDLLPVVCMRCYNSEAKKIHILRKNGVKGHIMRSHATEEEKKMLMSRDQKIKEATDWNWYSREFVEKHIAEGGEPPENWQKIQSGEEFPENMADPNSPKGVENVMMQ